MLGDSSRSPKSRPLSAMRTRILRALVGYLTVTALPFSPFAFAHPLADHDGFVDTSQNQRDGDLMKRVPGDIIEARQVPIVTVDALIVSDIIAIVGLSVRMIVGEGSVRGNEEVFLVDHID
jgi:hypothetical protein